MANYINDERWCERIAQTLHLKAVQLRIGSFRGARLVVEISPRLELLSDPRVPKVVREAFDYRNGEKALIIQSGNDRLRVERNGRIGAVVDGERIDIDKRALRRSSSSARHDVPAIRGPPHGPLATTARSSRALRSSDHLIRKCRALKRRRASDKRRVKRMAGVAGEIEGRTELPHYP